MPIDRPRRIFRGQSAPRRDPVGSTVIAGVVGAAGGAALVLLGLSSNLLGVAPPPSSSVVAEPGQVAVIDGNTLKLRDRVLRLRNVQSPQRGDEQMAQCGAVDCASAAATRLASLVRDRRVACRIDGRDTLGRPEAWCEANGMDLNRAMAATP